jgi:hypothetical protein
MSVSVRVEHIEDGYEVVLEDGDELVLAHYDTADCEACGGLHDADRHAREDAERYAAQVRTLLRATRTSLVSAAGRRFDRS